MGIRVTFIPDDTAKDVEVTVRAKQDDREAARVLALLGENRQDALICRTLSDEQEIDIGSVVIISKDGRFLSVKTTCGEYVVAEPLYKVEQRLDPTRFVRISQSEIVNLRYVKGWALEGGGIIRIELEGGVKSYTSRRYATEIRRILKKGGKKQ